MNAASPTTKLCDVCGKEDGFQNMNMQTCADCGVCVHEMCYGLENTDEGKKYARWKCFACSAVGTEIKVSKPGAPHRSILIKSRSTECTVCTVNTGVHAMHLLYDTHGKEGTPKVLPPNNQRKLEERVTWVHTLCAMFIGRHEGVIFGCQKDGTYDGHDVDSSDSEDEASEENEFNYYDPEDDSAALYASHHHFVVTEVGKGGKEDCWSRRVRVVKEARLKCYICGVVNGVKKDVFAIQCCYEDCAQSYHVGCARWGKGSERYERIEFNPGELDESGNEVTECIAKGYCATHSKRKNGTIIEKKDKKEERRQASSSPSIRQKRERAANYNKLMQDANSVIKEAKDHGRDMNKAAKRRKIHWKDSGGLNKTDFEDFWTEVCDSIIREQEEEDDEHENGGNKQPNNKWSHLWVPNYRPGLSSFSHWDSMEEITQDDVEQDYHMLK